MKFLLKAKALPVGTVRRRKSGKFIKDRPGHWKMLKEIVLDKLEGAAVHPNTSEAKTMQSAARQLARHMMGARNVQFSRSLADSYLNEQFGHLGYRRFGEWKRLTIDSVEKYFKHLTAVYEGDAARNPPESAQELAKWKADLVRGTQGLLSDTERDEWVAAQFAARKRPVGHILYAARELVGRGTHLSMVPDSGFKGLCKAIIEKCYDHGPAGLSKEQLEVWNKAFNTFFRKVEEGNANLMPLPKALAQIGTKKFFKENPKWFVYCCTRMAGKNDGIVDLGGIEQYMQRAMKYHKTKTPPPYDYDDPSGALRARVRDAMKNPAKPQKPREGKKTAVKRVFIKLKRRK